MYSHLVEEVVEGAATAVVHWEQKMTDLGNGGESLHFFQLPVLVQPGQHHLEIVSQ